MFWSKILDFFRRPSEEVAREILSNIGVFEFDEGYGILKTCLINLVGRKSREPSFIEFFGKLSNELFKKIRREINRRVEEAKEEARAETVRELGEQIAKIKEELVGETMSKAFSQGVLAIVDPYIYMILKVLREGRKSPNLLGRILNLESRELTWRINYLKDLGFIIPCYSGNSVDYIVSETAEKILEGRGAEFERTIDMMLDYKAHRLSMEAVGGNKMNAEKLESWLKSSKGRSHLTLIQKLYNECQDPKMLSQAFFYRKEMGVNQEKHIGIKITNHRAAGERLLLELEKIQNRKHNLENAHEKISIKGRNQAVAPSSA